MDCVTFLQSHRRHDMSYQSIMNMAVMMCGAVLLKIAEFAMRTNTMTFDMLAGAVMTTVIMFAFAVNVDTVPMSSTPEKRRRAGKKQRRGRSRRVRWMARS